ncbi:MAG: HAD family hydrolase [Firmicutes bacterium]|nr:HAD family hydrolase [Bacillota bacterium]
MKYKYFISDFDGTLLRSDNTVSKKSAEAIRAFQRTGGVFLIATGRMFSGVTGRFSEAGLDGLDIPVVAYHGAIVMTAVSQKVLVKNFLDFQTAAEIAAYAESKGLSPQTYEGGDICVPVLDEYGRKYAQYFGTGVREVGRVSDYIAGQKLDVPKILFFVDPAKMRGYIQEYTERFGGRAVFTASASYMFECMSPDAGKDKAAEFLTRSVGLTLESVAAIGDGFNDLDMIVRAGLGFAVANAEPEVRAAAARIVSSNDNHGVAEALEIVMDINSCS